MALTDLNLFKRDTPADTGTTYTSAGNDIQPMDLNEIGSQAGQHIFDPLPDLGNKFQRRRTFTKMVRADGSVRVSLRAGKAPVLGAEYFMDPFSQNEEDLIIGEFVEHNLFNNMTTPFLKLLEQILHFYRDGFSVCEPCWEMREWAPKITSPSANRKQYTMLRKMPIRPSETINRFIYDDNGGPVSVEQNAIRADGRTDLVTIPIGKLCVFTFDQDGGNLEGESILRSAYQPWFYKDLFYKIDAIQKERHGIGVPIVELQPGFSEADKKFANELARNLRTNEMAYIVSTPMTKVSFAEVPGNLVNALESAEHHDTMIMKNIMVQFLNSGTTSGTSGGRNTSATAFDMFLKTMRYIANMICEQINLYVIPNLVTYNFKTDRYPKLAVRNIGETKDLQMWAAAMANLIEKDAIIIDDETEQWIRKQVDMPKRTTPFEKAQPEVAANTPLVDGATPPVGTNGKPADAASTNGGGSSVTSGNVGKSPSSGVT